MESLQNILVTQTNGKWTVISSFLKIDVNDFAKIKNRNLPWEVDVSEI